MKFSLKDGRTALDLAQQKGHSQVMELLQSTQDQEKSASAEGNWWQGIKNLIRWPWQKNNLVIPKNIKSHSV